MVVAVCVVAPIMLMWAGAGAVVAWRRVRQRDPRAKGSPSR